MQYVTVQILLVLFVLVFQLFLPGDDVTATSMKINGYLAENMGLPPLSDELSAELEDNIDDIQDFFVKIGITTIFIIITMVAASAFFRSRVYNRLRHKKYTMKYFKKFFIYNAVWNILWLLLIGLIIFIFKIVIAIIIIPLLLIMFFHLSVVMRSSISEKKNMKKTLKEIFNVGIKKIHRFLLLILLIIIAFFVFTVVSFGLIPVFGSFIVNAIGLVSLFSMLFALLVIIGFFALVSYVRIRYLKKIKEVR